MSALPAMAVPDSHSERRLVKIGSFSNMRALAWSGKTLYTSRGYELFKAEISGQQSIAWESCAVFRPALWRSVTCANRLTSRLVRDGFHALAILPSGTLIAAVPGAIVTLRPHAHEFEITHRIARGTRPLHITAAPNGRVLWGEYFDNAARDEVHVYSSADQGSTWQIAYTFPKGSIRHVHNIVHDPWSDSLCVLTGDYGDECRILRASYDFRDVETLLQGNQQARAVALLAQRDGLYFSSDTPLEQNHIYRLDRQGKISILATIANSSIYGCRVGEAMFFSTMVEPSETNPQRTVRLYGSFDSRNWNSLLDWQKDRWPMKLFQYGNAFLPDGTNESGYLAVSTIAVEQADLQTSLYALRP